MAENIRFESEKCFEDLFVDRMEKTMINPVNGRSIVALVRQPKFGVHGRGDVLTVEKSNNPREPKILHLMELKITNFDYQNLGQISRYADFIDEMEIYSLLDCATTDYSLICKDGPTDGNLFLLTKHTSFNLYTYSIGFDGIKFKDMTSMSLSDRDNQNEQAAKELVNQMSDSVFDIGI